MARIDTSIDGYKHVGINLTEQQYEGLMDLNIVMMHEDRKHIPVFNMMILLKTLGLLPKEMLGNESPSDDIEPMERHSRKFGKYVD